MGHDTGAVCLCMSRHRPAPLELERHHIWPRGMGGPDVPSNLAWVCPTTHTNTHELLRVMVRRRALVSLREFQDALAAPVSRYAFDLAVDGFRRWQGGG